MLLTVLSYDYTATRDGPTMNSDGTVLRSNSSSKRPSVLFAAIVSVVLALGAAVYTRLEGKQESFSGVFYVSETPFPCGRDLQKLCTTLEVSPPSGQAGLIWSPNWEKTTGSDGTAIGTGYQNTIDILAQSTAPLEYAAAYANAYVYNGKDDWYLPSKDELNELCKSFANNRTDVTPTTDVDGNKSSCVGSRVPLAGFSTANYWSSSQETSNTVWSQHFTSGDQYPFYKLNAGYVRPVRAF